MKRRLLFVGFLALLMPGLCSCSGPKIRMGAYASSTMGTNFPNPKKLGKHGTMSEKNGQVYTCRAGHIDLAHLRKSVDWTEYLAKKTYKNIFKNNRKFTFKLREPSVYYVELTYPENWDNYSSKTRKRIAREVSISLGQYFSYTATTWHEIVTWFGYKCSGIYSEFPSAFSWEDTISNLLGTYVAAEALWDREHSFKKAVTIALDKELRKLEVQPSDVAKAASEDIRGNWYSGGLVFFVTMHKRNLDIGLDDRFVTPWTVPSVCQCNGSVPRMFLTPNTDILSEYGFSMKFEIKPRLWESGKIMKIVYRGMKKRKKRLEPAIHFGPIMDYIREDAKRRYGDDVENPVQYSLEN